MSIQLNVYPPLPTVEETIHKYVKKIDAVISARLLNGFDWQPPAATLPAAMLTTFENVVPVFRFSTKMSDQLNITQAAVLAGQAVSMGNMDWTRSWQGWYQNTQHELLFNLENWSAFTIAYAVAKDSCLSQGWTWKAILRSKTTADEATEAFKTFGISDQEITLAESAVDATL